MTNGTVLEDFFKENSIPTRYQKNIVFELEHSIREITKKSYKDYAETLIKCRIFSKVKKNELSSRAYETLEKITTAVFPEWDLNQLSFEIEIDDLNKNISIIEKNDLTRRLFNTIINF